MRYAFIKDNVPIVDAQHLSDVSNFEQVYLINKVLGESIPLKFIKSKCIIEWNINDEANIVDMINVWLEFGVG